MSAGTGVEHSEYNHSKTEKANTLQIWLFPKFKNIPPRYDQRDFKGKFKPNEFTTLVTGDKNVDALWINQDATFSLGEFEAGNTTAYHIKLAGNGAYIFVLEGSVKIDGQVLNKKDAVGVYDTSSITIDTQANSRILIIDVPMLQ
jgi:redox-sensitive bicupin YhaK (pirin superfamily)